MGSADPLGHEDGDQTGESIDLETAKQIALRRLTIRARSCEELRADLRARGASPQVSDAVVDRFVEVGLLNDEEFAAGWVRTRRQAKSLSSSALIRELTSKGVERQIADQAVAEGVDDDTALAVAYARKRARTMGSADRDTMARRLMAQLARRGFTQSVARHAVLEALGEMDDR